jgi:hypothetical protein
MSEWKKMIAASPLVFFTTGCSSSAGDTNATTGPGGSEAVATSSEAVTLGTSEITFKVIEYWFDEGFDLLDDRDMRATVSIDGNSQYKDLEPGCCSGQSAIGIPRDSGTEWAREVPVGSTVGLTVEMVEDDSGDDDVQDIKPGPGSKLSLSVNTHAQSFSGDLTSQEPCWNFGDGCTACTGPRGQGDGLCFGIRVESNCDRQPFWDETETKCDGQDGDCDGSYDENYTQRTLCTLCGTPTSCVAGREVLPECQAECTRAPAFETTWLQYLNAWDFDVAADKMCMLHAVAIPGTQLGNVVCTTQGGGGNSQFIQVPAPAEFASTCNNGTCVSHCDTLSCSSHVSLDPFGRVWATTPAGIWTTRGDGTLHLVAPKPAGCASIRQIELAGPADRNYLGPTARPFVSCSDDSLFEFVPETGAWISHAQAAWSLGASPRAGFELFFNGPTSNGTPMFFGMNPDDSLRYLWLLNDETDSVGGAYVMFGAAANAEIRQWTGATLEPVADLANPLEFPHIADGKYGRLHARLTDAGGSPLKIAEGGGLGVGGPSPSGTTDVLWILNDSFRVYSYNVAPVSADVTGSFRADDRLAVTAKALAIAGQTPEAVCQDLVLAADASCGAFVDAAAVDAGSFDPNGDELTLSLSAEGTFPLGITTVALTASDGVTDSTCTATVTVVDTSPPVITPPPTTSTKVCDTTGAVAVGQATVSDNCGATVSGQVVSRNGVALSPPVDVIAGQAALGIGTNVVRWTASDGANQTEVTSTVTVGTTIQASQSFVVGDRSKVLLPNGLGAAVFSSGTQETRIGTDALVGAIASVAPVRVLDRSQVGGSIVSAGLVTISSTAVSGPVTNFGSVVLPALPVLPSFPAPSGGSFVLNNGQTRTLSQGSYDGVTLNGGSTLVLAAGDYFFRNLTVNTNVRVIVSPGTRVFVRDALAYRSPFTLANGSPAIATLGFGGTGTLYLEAAFRGTLLAPAAHVVFGSGSPTSNLGSFYARAIEVRTGSTLTCVP